MTGFIIRMLTVMLGLWIASEVVPGIEVQGVATLAGAAFLLGIVNAVIRPLLIVLTFPVTVVTLGLFLLVINAAMLGLVAWMFDDFNINGFWPALFGSIIVSIIGWAAAYFVGPHGRIKMLS